MTKLQEELFKLQDLKYRDFSSRLTPDLSKENIIGIRLPVLRKFAKDFDKTPEAKKFLGALPHQYFDENMLHIILLSKFTNFEEWLIQIEKFLPEIDNWAVCDSAPPKCVKKHHSELLKKSEEWTKSKETYTCRYGIGILMREFLDKDFSTDQLDLVSSIKSEEYYVNMMIAWYFATALAKQWEATIPYIEKGIMAPWVHNKTIQKAIESFRITPEQKNYLRTLRK